MKNLLNRLIEQLDALIPFLALAHEKVFNLLQRDQGIWFFAGNQQNLPKVYITYRKHIAHGAFLLGYGYSEAFLSDLIREIYMHNPHMLPDDKTLKFSELRKTKSHDDVLRIMIDKEIYAVFAQSMEDIADYFSKKFSLKWPDAEKPRLVEASLLRNCIIHNSAIADFRLTNATKNKYKEGYEIILEPSEVHSYGLVMRRVARDLWKRATKAFLNNKTKKRK